MQQERDFGIVLAFLYGVQASRYDSNNSNDTNSTTTLTTTPVQGGSLQDALERARQEARLLLVLLPAGKPGQAKTNAADVAAVTSFLSAPVAAAAEQPARTKSKKQKGSTTHSDIALVFAVERPTG